MYDEHEPLPSAHLVLVVLGNVRQNLFPDLFHLSILCKLFMRLIHFIYQFVYCIVVDDNERLE